MDAVPFWATTAAIEDVRLLDHGTVWEQLPRADVAVVGGGIVGLAIAAMCRRAGLDDVVVLERDRLACGPSGRAGGVLAPEPHAWTDPSSLVEFGRRSLDLARQLDDEWRGELAIRELSCLLADRRIEDASIPIAAPIETLDEQAVRQQEPAVVGVTNAVLIHRQAHVHPLVFAAALARHAGVIRTGVDVTGHDLVGGTVVRLHTSAGVLHPGVVIYATGRAPAPEVTVPHALVKGHLAVTEPLDIRLTSRVVAPAGGAMPLPGGRLLTGGTIDDGDLDPDVRPGVVEAIRRGLDSVIPAAASAPFSNVWTCFRPATPDRLPIIDRLPGAANAWFTSGHYGTGLLLALATGEAIADWIIRGTQPRNVTPFDLSRFNLTDAGS